MKLDKVVRDRLKLADVIVAQTGRIDELHGMIAEMDDEMNASSTTSDAAANGKSGD